MVVPRSLGGLLADGGGAVVNAPVLEVFLLCLLHLHNEAAAIDRRAIDIEDGTAVSVAVAEVLAVQVLYVGYLALLSLKEGIEETDEQVFVHLCTEEFLETEVGIGVYVAFI